LLIYASLDGIERELFPPAATNINLYASPVSALADYKRLPTSLLEARCTARESSFIWEHLPETVVQSYCGA